MDKTCFFVSLGGLGGVIHQQLDTGEEGLSKQLMPIHVASLLWIGNVVQ